MTRLARLSSCALVVVVVTGHSGTTANAVVFDQENFPHAANPPPTSDLNNLPGDLRDAPVPVPPNIGDFIKDSAAAIRLGKALFWDMQVGSDDVQACASCHFRAGADPRSKNQVSPGLKHVPDADPTFTAGGPNYQLSEEDFPLSGLQVPGTRGALDPATDNDDVVSSQGVHHLAFEFVGHGWRRRLVAIPDPLNFRLGPANTRRVEPRNTPSVINAVFNHRQFWDGRAENVFNGVNHRGTRDLSAMVVRATNPHSPVEVRVEIPNASLASQAVAPIVSNLEMARPGRTELDVGRELARTKGMDKRRPLALQRVHPRDSVLGPLSRWPLRGLDVSSYDEMIRAAFRSEWWNSSKLVRVAADGTRSFVKFPDVDPDTKEYTLTQYNFALFFGLAVQMYEATLVSDDTPWDRFRREHPSSTDPALNPWTNEDPGHVSRLALFGATIFNDRTRGPTNLRCSNCHEQAELTDASVRRITAATNGPVRNRDGNVIDKGFNNIGVRPTSDDLGAGGSDALGPLSHAQRRFPTGVPAVNQPCTTAADCPATFTCITSLCAWDGTVVSKGFGVEGAMKIPSLRNVALTAPYFHNGDALTLRQVMAFYSRGGNVAPINQFSDGVVIEPLGVPVLTEAEVDALVAFMEALTDERVRYARAPFDHPEIFVPNGHPGDHTFTIDADGDGQADDALVRIPAVGAAGGPELPGFLEFGAE
jgi:cytochrome c peroxidase